VRDTGTWDIKTSVGSTALFVAAARGLAGRQPDPIVVDPFAEIFCIAAGDEWAALFTSDPATTAEHPLRTTNFGVPFQSYQAIRTRYFDDYTAAAVDAGVRQIVIVAAGMDSRAYRLPVLDGVRVFELDQPRVLEFKRTTLFDHGHEPIAERREVPADLRLDWPTALRDSGFDPAVPAAWLVEGLLVYLSPAEQGLLFEQIESLSVPGSHVGIDPMDNLDPEIYRNMIEQRSEEGGSSEAAELNRTGAGWANLVHNEPRGDAVEWFGRRGWNGTATRLSDHLGTAGRQAAASEISEYLLSLVRFVTVIKDRPSLSSAST
jgi:methyltransferase (TIGR00027 family)